MAMSQQHATTRAIASSQFHPRAVPSHCSSQNRLGQICIATLLLLSMDVSLQAGLNLARANDERLIAQQVLNTLPPPPSVTFGQNPLPVIPIESMPSATDPLPAIAPTSGERYLVYVNGSSPLLLSQVQAVEPSALYREYEGRTVIQAGVFSDETNAQEQVERLQSRGIGASIKGIEVAAATPIPVSSSPVMATSHSVAEQIPVLPPAPVLREIEFGQQPNESAVTGAPIPIEAAPAEAQVARLESPARYFVVIPGSREQLAGMSEQVNRLLLDAPRGGVQSMNSSRGPHVRVGPFRDRSTAENWKDYLRAFGMDARVHYRR